MQDWRPAIDFIPHRPPMLLVDFVRLLEPEEGLPRGEARSLVKSAWPVLDASGNVLAPGLFEVAAQSFAAIAGLQLALSGQSGAEKRLGFLVALKRFNFSGSAKIGDELLTNVSITAALGEFSVVQSEVRLGGALLAEGQLKVYCPTADEVQKMLGA